MADPDHSHYLFGDRSPAQHDGVPAYPGYVVVRLVAGGSCGGCHSGVSGTRNDQRHCRGRVHCQYQHLFCVQSRLQTGVCRIGQLPAFVELPGGGRSAPQGRKGDRTARKQRHIQLSDLFRGAQRPAQERRVAHRDHRRPGFFIAVRNRCIYRRKIAKGNFGNIQELQRVWESYRSAKGCPVYGEDPDVPQITMRRSVPRIWAVFWPYRTRPSHRWRTSRSCGPIPLRCCATVWRTISSWGLFPGENSWASPFSILPAIRRKTWCSTSAGKWRIIRRMPISNSSSCVLPIAGRGCSGG